MSDTLYTVRYTIFHYVVYSVHSLNNVKCLPCSLSPNPYLLSVSPLLSFLLSVFVPRFPSPPPLPFTLSHKLTHMFLQRNNHCRLVDSSPSVTRPLLLSHFQLISSSPLSLSPLSFSLSLSLSLSPLN